MLRSKLQRFLSRQQSYKLVDEDVREPIESDEDAPVYEEGRKQRFSWLVYSIFLLMGVSMLWAWNMFLAAAPYFQLRFASNDWVRANSQSSITSVSSTTSLCGHILLANRQKNASYPRRVSSSLILTISVFTLLSVSTLLARDVSTGVYFFFILAMVFVSATAASMCQNGLFAYVSSFGQPEYTQAIMAGQAVAGVLPCIVQVISVLAMPQDSEAASETTKQDQSAKSAFTYFSTAAVVSALSLFAFFYLVRRQSCRLEEDVDTGDSSSLLQVVTPTKRPIPLLTLFRKLRWNALAIYICFAVTMMSFPIFTSEIQSVRDEDPLPRFFRPAAFIPFAFLFWNVGDLLGRVMPLLPLLNLNKSPFMVFAISTSRIIFIPLYMMCNVRGQGATINSDLFYLFVVQGLSGVTNGYVCALSMIGAADMVDPEEREATGGFMGLILTAGLTTGSLLSFFVASRL